MDKEKVIRSIDRCVIKRGKCHECDYYTQTEQEMSCRNRLLMDALVLLKEQEAMVKPTKCPCGELFDAKDSSFCPKCGCAYGELSGRYTNIGR